MFIVFLQRVLNEVVLLVVLESQFVAHWVYAVRNGLVDQNHNSKLDVLGGWQLYLVLNYHLLDDCVEDCQLIVDVSVYFDEHLLVVGNDVLKHLAKVFDVFEVEVQFQLVQPQVPLEELHDVGFPVLNEDDGSQKVNIEYSELIIHEWSDVLLDELFQLVEPFVFEEGLGYKKTLDWSEGNIDVG